jgi:hypothetical protein
MVSMVMRFKSKLISIHLEIVLIFMQNSCTVWAECTICLKSFWMHPMELLDDLAHVESHFHPFRAGVRVGAR